MAFRPHFLWTSLGIALVASLILTACGGSPEPGVLPSTSGATGSEASGTQVDPEGGVSMTLDASQASHAVIPTTGGILKAEGSDGTRYTLDIPEGALLVDTEITMTPVSAIEDFPFSGGLGGAVKLEPDGLFFYEDAILTIEPADDIPVENQVFFGFDAESQGLYLAMPVVDSAAIQIRLQHFSGAGVGNGVSAEVAKALDRIADRNEARIRSEVGQYLSEQRMRTLLNDQEDNTELVAQLEAAMKSSLNDVVKPRLKAALSASATCEQGRRAVQTLLGYERQRQLLGFTGPQYDPGVDLSDLFVKLGRKCLDEAYQACQENHVIHQIIPAWLGYERQRQLLGVADDSGTSDYGWQLVEKCLRFELKFESAGQFDGYEGEGAIQSRVTSSIPLRFASASILSARIEGQAPLVNENFSIVMTDDYFNVCQIENRRGGGEFSAIALAPIVKSQGENSVVTDLVLAYDPGNTSESYRASCKQTPDPNPRPPLIIEPPPSAYWTSMYKVLHMLEVDTSGRYDSTIVGGDLPVAPAGPELPVMPDFNDPAAVQAFMEQMSASMGEDAEAPSGASMPPFLLTADTQGGALIARGWTIIGGELFATLEWEKNDGELGLTEIGGFKLFHRPGQ